MFKNLLHEFKRNNVKIEDVAHKMKLPQKILIDKINGKVEFKIEECLELQRILGKRDICLEYLFEN